MTGTMLFSIVIPARNAAPWLPECLASIVALDPPPNEIIVVDDASTDDTAVLLAEFCLKCPTLRTIRLDESGGASGARNRGLEAARGKYLAYVDADDLFLPGRFRDALMVAERDHLDLVFLNAIFHHEDRKNDLPVFRQSHPTEITTGSEWLKSVLRSESLHHAVWLHLYRTEWLRGTGLRFPVGITHEDVIWTTEVLLHARRMRYLPNTDYHYRIFPREFDRATTQTRLEFVVRSSIANARRLADLALDVTDPELRSLLQSQLVDGALSIFHHLEKMPDRSRARAILIGLRRNGFLAFLLHHASGFGPLRRILKHWLRSWGYEIISAGAGPNEIEK